ncbi:TIGR04211 family SH3 domain-containing protein [Alteromonas antoniana]|uniref:TIGR04211 family SH3 domain-containing protein n=1 Tax=Alteromonas antoniana TaxID=2803813 RepID=UPI001C4455FA|nr:TIGR04211 family SH3 domain-containing protein [Alteromonas antoniana]
MIRRWLSVALIAVSFQSFGLQDTADIEASSSHYIRDDLFVFLHAGPGRNYRILGSIEAGTPITLLDTNREEEFSQVKDDEGRTGWVETRYVSNTISMAEQLPLLSEQLADSQTSLQAVRNENTQLRQQLSEARQTVAQLTQQTEEQAREVTALSAKIERADQDELVRWFTRGGLVAGAGILLGVILTYLPKKRKRSDQWM